MQWLLNFINAGLDSHNLRLDVCTICLASANLDVDAALCIHLQGLFMQRGKGAKKNLSSWRRGRQLFMRDLGPLQSLSYPFCLGPLLSTW